MATNHRYIAVDGPIGAGKTTLVNMLAQGLGGIAILEPSQKNPFLSEFYKDRSAHAFKTQIYFLLNRYQQQQSIKKEVFDKKVLVCDYTFVKDKIFADLNLNDDERILYNQIFDALMPKVPKPDLVIYLQASPDKLLKRIRSRKLPHEKEITKEYLEDLTNAYNEYFFNFTIAPLLVINSSDLDYVKNREDWEELKKVMLSHRSGISHFHYVSKS